MNQTDPALDVDAPAHGALVRSHLRIGWWMLLAFVILGALLEAMHGFKFDLYLNVERASTRTLWTLAHAAGAVLGLVHVAFAATLYSHPNFRSGVGTVASACLKCASVTCPAACLVAGLVTSAHGLAWGAVLAIPGLCFLLLGLLLTAVGLRGDA